MDSDGDHIDCLGVADNINQIKKHLGVYSTNETPRKICIKVTPIRKKDQHETGGWRWHKWGAYIGTQKPKMEYLYNEPNIDLVYVFHIYEMETQFSKRLFQ